MTVTVSRHRPRRFYTFIGLAMSIIVLIGFSRTYYLKAWFDTPPLTLRLHLHGLVMTLWLAAFVVQARLIAAGQRNLHKTLGVLGVGLAVAAVVTTYGAAIETARHQTPIGRLSPADRLYSQLLLVMLFGVFVAAGTAFRKRPEIHKRFMLLATIAALGPGIARAVPLIAGRGWRDVHIPVMAVLVLSGLVYDWRTRGRPQWVLLSGGAVLIALQLTRRLVGGSNSCGQIENWLIG